MSSKSHPLIRPSDKFCERCGSLKRNREILDLKMSGEVIMQICGPCAYDIFSQIHSKDWVKSNHPDLMKYENGGIR